MLRFIVMLAFAAAISLQIVKDAPAAMVDKGPPYTDAEFIALSVDRIPNSFRKTLPEWWARAPDDLRKHVLNSPSQMWWSIILCNFQGFKPNVSGRENSTKCEQDSYNAQQRGKNMWTEDGQWIGPSEECKKRDKRTQWGELICD